MFLQIKVLKRFQIIRFIRHGIRHSTKQKNWVYAEFVLRGNSVCWCQLTWGWPVHSRMGAPWSTGPPGPDAPRCWCCRRFAACWPASCSPPRSSGVYTHSPSLSAASPPPSAASWAPTSECRWPHQPGHGGGCGNEDHSSWTRRPCPCPPSQLLLNGVITSNHRLLQKGLDLVADYNETVWFVIFRDILLTMAVVNIIISVMCRNWNLCVYYSGGKTTKHDKLSDRAVIIINGWQVQLTADMIHWLQSINRKLIVNCINVLRTPN